MQVTCPCCNARFPIEAALTDEAAREAVAAALRLPTPLGDLVLRYLGLFRPEKRALSWDRAVRLLGELAAPMAAGQVERHGRAWAAPLETWRQALEQVLANRDKLQLPLRSHGYLFEVVAGIAGKAQGRAEQREEEHKQYRYHRESSGGPRKPLAQVDRERGRQETAALKDLLTGANTDGDA